MVETSITSQGSQCIISFSSDIFPYVYYYSRVHKFKTTLAKINNLNRGCTLIRRGVDAPEKPPCVMTISFAESLFALQRVHGKRYGLRYFRKVLTSIGAL